MFFFLQNITKEIARHLLSNSVDPEQTAPNSLPGSTLSKPDQIVLTGCVQEC